MAEALINDLPKAHILVSEMTPMEGFRLAEIVDDGKLDTEATDAFDLTSRWQISRDLVEEWLACDSPPLSHETRFSDFEQRDGYVFLHLGVAPSDAFSTDFSFVNFIEHKAEEIIGFYDDRKHKDRCQSLAGKRRLNHTIGAMGLCYADRVSPSTSLPADDVAPRGCGAWGRRGRA